MSCRECNLCPLCSFYHLLVTYEVWGEHVELLNFLFFTAASTTPHNLRHYCFCVNILVFLPRTFCIIQNAGSFLKHSKLLNSLFAWCRLLIWSGRKHTWAGRAIRGVASVSWTPDIIYSFRTQNSSEKSLASSLVLPHLLTFLAMAQAFRFVCVLLLLTPAFCGRWP